MDDLKRKHTIQPGSIIVVAAALMAIGIVMIASATAPLDRSILAVPLWHSVFGRQVVFVIVGLTAAVIARYVVPPVLARPALRYRICQVFFVLVLVGLMAALAPSLGSPQRGSHRWLQFASLSTEIGFQPSEFGKLAMVGLLAAFLTDRGADLGSFRRGFLPVAGAVGLCCLLVGKEDFGTAVLLAIVGSLTLFVAGCRLRHLLLMASVGIGAFAVLLVAAPYRLARIAAYKDIWADPQGAGYQPLQSLTAIAEGGWLGTGLGAGVQKYGYLPESHSDFIFSVICEETGFLGAVLVIGLYLIFTWLGLRTMLAARTPFERILAFGITATVSLQAAMNIAVATVVTPTTGISLPLISAGGSGVLTFSLAVGVLAAIAARAPQGCRAGGAADNLREGSSDHGEGWEAVAW
ncbi:MAG: FtsW/RodA/SpoVE family cell cycle protein [Planctomycetota bacterium]|jgi:cell division protein FtsW